MTKKKKKSPCQVLYFLNCPQMVETVTGRTVLGPRLSSVYCMGRLPLTESIKKRVSTEDKDGNAENSLRCDGVTCQMFVCCRITWGVP